MLFSCILDKCNMNKMVWLGFKLRCSYHFNTQETKTKKKKKMFPYIFYFEKTKNHFKIVNKFILCSIFISLVLKYVFITFISIIYVLRH
jgi:hypothetical protein